MSFRYFTILFRDFVVAWFTNSQMDALSSATHEIVFSPVFASNNDGVDFLFCWDLNHLLRNESNLIKVYILS